MATFTYRGDRLGEALQFDDQGRRTRVEIGQVWFAPTDVVTIETDPAASRGVNFLGGEGAVVALSVRTADGQVTDFFASPDGLDVDPDPGKRGADFFFISETPGSGVGGFYDGLQIEKILVADRALAAGAEATFESGAAYRFESGSGGGSGGGGSGGGGSGGGGRTLVGDDGDDRLSGRGGRDEIDGASGDDRLDGRGGADAILGGSGDDTLFGRGGADLLDGEEGNDDIFGHGGDDSLIGGAGDDDLSSGGGRDSLDGGEGNDRLLGGGGRDRLTGGEGDDDLVGGGGADLLTGGEGNDAFVFSAGDAFADFGRDDGDTIVVQDAAFADLVFTRQGDDLVVALGDAEVLLLDFAGTPAEEDFLFV